MTTADDSPATTNMADDEDAQPEVLQPCAVCRRKFNPRSLDKHVKICERAAARKRKPFDSAWQRIQGTELAEFLPKKNPPSSAEPSRRDNSSSLHYEDRPCHKPTNAWKQTRDEFLRAIRAARGHNVSSLSQHRQYHQHHQHQHGTSSSPSQALHQRPSTLSLVTSPGAPMRSNEKGQCPTCHRQFGVKSYERHVAFCKERSTRLPASPQISNNVAKERLDARMKYRAPVLRNKRPTNREKYSPGSQKTIVPPSPHLTRTPTKEGSLTSVKSDNASPKLPLLKRTGLSNHKESLSASTGPLKSRPVDRSNRRPDSQNSNPPTLRQLFTPRRLVLLSDVFPSKILQSKKSQGSSSSQRSSAKLVSNFLQKEFIDSPGGNSEQTQKKIKKKIKLRNRGPEKKHNSDKNEREDLVTDNKKLRENTARKIIEIEDIDNEEEPNLSDVTGLSSLDEENFAIDDFERNEKIICSQYEENSVYLEDVTNKSDETDTQIFNSENERNPDFMCSNESSNVTINQIYFAEDSSRLASLSLTDKNSTTTFNIDVKNDIDNYDSDGGMSTSSKKTFRKSNHSINKSNFDDSLGPSALQEKNSILEFNESELINESSKKLTKPRSCQIEDNEFTDKTKKSESISSEKKIKEQPLTFPIKFNSMPNISDTKIVKIQKIQKNVDMRLEKIEIPELSAKGSDGKIEAMNHETGINQTNACNRRCATYVIDNARDANSRDQRVNDDSSEEKPLKKRRKLHQRSRHNGRVNDNDEDEDEDDDEDDEADDDDEDKESSENKMERMQAEPINNIPEMQSPLLNENKAACNISETPSKTFVAYDYYRNKTTSFSNRSSGSTDDQRMLEFDEELDNDDLESNASELLKEIDVNIMNSNLYANSEKFEWPSDYTRLDFMSRARRPESLRSKKSRNEEAWISTVEVSGLSKERVDKGTQYFEKEICTITRLDSVPQNEPFLPSIGGKSSVQSPNWRERVEYHREKLVKSNSKSRIFELEKFKVDKGDKDLRMSSDPYQSSRIPPQIRRLSHFDRRGVTKDYDPFLLAEQQLNDLFSDTSDQSSTDGSAIFPSRKPASSPNFSRSHSSAFAKYPSLGNVQPQVQQQQPSAPEKPQQRGSLIAPPTGFDDPTSSDLSSDCADTHPSSSSTLNSLGGQRPQGSGAEREHVLGRRLIIDQSQALGGGEFAPTRTANGSSTSKLARSTAAGARSVLAPKPPERKISSSSSSGSSDLSHGCSAKSRSQPNSSKETPAQQRANSELKSLNGSNLSLTSIISTTDMEIKRSNSLLDELLSTFEDEGSTTPTLPSLMTLMRNDPSLSMLSSKPQPQKNGLNGHHQGQNASLNSNNRSNCSDDEGDSSSPESGKRQECGGKLSADSAYSSLNRKHSSYGRSMSEIASNKLKLSKFCHECGFKFPDTAKFCCECGIQRLTL